MFRKRHTPVGAKPGTLMINAHAQRPQIRVMKYKPDHLEEHDVAVVTELKNVLEENTVCWVDVQGLGDEKVLREFADLFSIHPLALEDVVNVPQRPKIERFEEHTLCITRMALLREEGIEPEQVSVFVGPNYVLTFQERSGDVFDPIRNRVRQKGPILLSSGPSYLAYALLDAVIDGYYPILERFGEKLEALEDEIVANPQPTILQEIHHAKRDLLALRRAIWPQREAINALIRDENPLITDRVRVYLRDCYDHCVQIMDGIETYRELAGGLMDVYLSSVGNRQNEVMKVLTIMASIFIPLTFMAGIYGMNFENMPELHSRWGYPFLLAAMVAVAVGMIVYFHRRGWLGSRPPQRPKSEADPTHEPARH
ncbi:MAG: magnesium/cobalt transporter CorA [Phycisphaerales bacterium]|nr:MAG: magnesium/cobalt transporter CorA [Phycisphaerales bacterium]